IGSSADTSCLYFENRHDVVHSLFKYFQSRLLGLCFYSGECSVYNLLSYAFLTIQHDIVDQLGIHFIVVQRIRQYVSLLSMSFTWHGTSLLNTCFTGSSPVRFTC